jgi:nucleoside-diphosphate-sugar epimerase
MVDAGTGGASGLGLAVVERLVELGARVVVLDLRPPVVLPPGAAYVEADVGSRGRRPTVPWPRRSTCSEGSRSPSAVPGSPVQADFARVVTVNLIGPFLV